MTAQNSPAPLIIYPSEITNNEANMAVPIIFYNNSNEVYYLIQDNAPTWRVFGNGFFYGQPQNSAQHPGIFRDNALFVTGRETNVPYEAMDKMHTLYSFNGIQANGDFFEGNAVIAVPIGDFKLESKKGAYIKAFSEKDRPQNTIAGHDWIATMAFEALRDPAGYEGRNYVVEKLPHRWVVLDQLIANGTDIADLKIWTKHPKVADKLALYQAGNTAEERAQAFLTRHPDVPELWQAHPQVQERQGKTISHNFWQM